MIGFLTSVAWPFVRKTLVPAAVTHWKVVAIVAASGLAIGEGVKIRSDLIDKGRQQEITRQKKAEYDTLRTRFIAESLRADAATANYRVDTIRLNHLVARTDTLRDSVVAHIHDTLWVERYVDTTTKTIQACRETVRSCDAIQADLRAQITTLKSQVTLAAPRVDTIRTSRCGWGGALGGGGVYDLRDSRFHWGPSATLLFSCHR